MVFRYAYSWDSQAYGAALAMYIFERITGFVLPPYQLPFIEFVFALKTGFETEIPGRGSPEQSQNSVFKLWLFVREQKTFKSSCEKYSSCLLHLITNTNNFPPLVEITHVRHLVYLAVSLDLNVGKVWCALLCRVALFQQHFRIFELKQPVLDHANTCQSDWSSR